VLQITPAEAWRRLLQRRMIERDIDKELSLL